jgi:8-hydroxy-5-deazaflavin:NADPH oxidoreductase
MQIGIIGAGMIGSTVGELWIDAGHDVRFASRHPETLQPLVTKLGPHASAGSPADAAAFGEVVMVTVPLRALPELARDIGHVLAGKVVLDTSNAYDKRDGDTAGEARGFPGGSAAWAAALFPKSKWVKAFNSVNFKTLESEAHRDDDLVGIPLASDDVSALAIASKLVRDAGFDPVLIGPLAAGVKVEPGTAPYNTGMSGPHLRRVLGV